MIAVTIVSAKIAICNLPFLLSRFLIVASRVEIDVLTLSLSFWYVVLNTTKALTVLSSRSFVVAVKSLA